MCDGDNHNDYDDDDSLWQTLFNYCWQCNVRAWGMWSCLFFKSHITLIYKMFIR